MFRWSGGLVVRAVKVFMVAKVVQVVPMVQVMRLGRVAHVVIWSGGQVVRVVSLDDMLSENIWFQL